jgi:AcrR family transcriptional regulator
MSLPVARPRKPPPAVAEAVRTTLTPEDWVEAATTLLVDEGIDSVRIDVLARRLGVTRGSFYWHFKDRDDLLKSVLQAWRARATEQVTARFESRQAAAPELVRELISLPFRGRSAARAARIELALRAWARRDEIARQAVDEADAARIAYHAQVFSALGFSIAEARMRAFLLYGYEVAESLLHRQGTASQRQERSRFVEQLLQQRLGS